MRRYGMCVVVLCTLGVQSVHANLLPGNAAVAGQSQLFWADHWWPWAINQPLATNPLLDTTGAHAGSGDQGPIFFLAGSTTTDPVVRNITVPAGKPIFLPIINQFADNTNVPGQPPTTFSASELLGLIDPSFNTASPSLSVFLTVDGVSQTGLLSHRQTSNASSPFSYTTTSNDNLIDGVFGGDSTLNTGAYPSTVSPVVQDGYWAAFDAFSPGSVHALHFGGTTGAGFTQDITYNITTAPEPTTVTLVFPLTLIVARRRKRVGNSN